MGTAAVVAGGGGGAAAVVTAAAPVVTAEAVDPPTGVFHSVPSAARLNNNQK